MFDHPISKENYDLLMDLKSVGSKKSIGYLPIHNLEKIYPKLDFQKEIIPIFQEFVKKNPNLILKVYSKEECIYTFSNGALYIYDKLSIQQALDKNQEMLKKYSIPTLAEKFVDHIVKNFYGEPSYPEVSKFITFLYSEASVIKQEVKLSRSP